MDKHTQDLVIALEYMMEMVGDAPDANCSCHLCPPCNDCVEYSGIRESFASARAAIAKAKGQTP